MNSDRQSPLWRSVQRLALGVILLAMASAVLLFSDLRSRNSTRGAAVQPPGSGAAATVPASALSKLWRVQMVNYNHYKELFVKQVNRPNYSQLLYG